jgi:hypothetical protein
MEAMVYLHLGLAITTAVYSAALHQIRHLYAPDYIWVTVVGGNMLIGVAYLLCQLAYPLEGVAAFWLLFSLNVAGGIPVIIWQVGEQIQRHSNQRNYRHDKTITTRRTSVD